jgi:hypothetical protein
MPSVRVYPISTRLLAEGAMNVVEIVNPRAGSGLMEVGYRSAKRPISTRSLCAAVHNSPTRWTYYVKRSAYPSVLRYCERGVRLTRGRVEYPSEGSRETALRNTAKRFRVDSNGYLVLTPSLDVNPTVALVRSGTASTHSSVNLTWSANTISISLAEILPTFH